MAQDIPPKTPEWASNPDPAPPTIIAEPLPSEKEKGWQPGQPFREYVNWFWNLTWQWIVWFRASTFRFHIFGEDQAIPSDGAIPPTGGGSLIRVAGDFSARVIADGFLGLLVDSLDHTYAANHATFWDLRRDGVWVPVALPLPIFGSPAVTPNAARVYRVDTDGTEPIAVVDLRPSELRITKPLSFGRSQRFGHLDTLYQTPGRITQVGVSAFEYTLVESFQAVADLLGSSRLYIRSDGIPVLVRGAIYNGAVAKTWTIDPNHVGDVQYTPLDGQSFHAKHLSQSVGSPFADTLWSADADLAGNLDRELVHDGTIIAGQAFATTPEPGVQSNLPTFVAQASSGKDERQYTLNGGVRSGNVYTLLANTNQGTAGASRGREECSNCWYDGVAAQWHLTAAGADALKWEVSTTGLRLLRHLESDGATWNDTIAATTWAVLWSVRQPLDKWIPASRVQQRTGGSSDWEHLIFQALASAPTELNAIQKTAVSAPAPGVIWFEETDLPNGAIIDRIDIVVTPNENLGEFRFAAVRSDITTGAHQSFVDGADGEETATGGTKQTIPLTISVNETIRTIDRSRYVHGVWFAGTLDANTIMHGLRIRYRVV